MRNYIILVLALAFASCTIQKRHFRKGYTIDWNKNKRSTSKVEVAQKEFLTDVEVTQEESIAEVKDSVQEEEIIHVALKDKSEKKASAQKIVRQIVQDHKSKIRQFVPLMKTDESEDELIFRHKSASMKLIIFSVILAGLGFIFLLTSITPPMVLIIMLFSLAGLLLLFGILKYITFYRQTTPGYTKSEKELESDKAYQKKKGVGSSISTDEPTNVKPQRSGQIGSEGGTIIGFALIGLGLLLLISALVLVISTAFIGLFYGIMIGGLGMILFIIGMFIAIGANQGS